MPQFLIASPQNARALGALGLALVDVPGIGPKAQTIETNSRQAIENTRMLIGDLKRLPFIGGRAAESEESLDKADAALETFDVDSLVELSEVANDVSGLALEIERTILGPKGLIVGASIILGLVGIGYWWGRRTSQQE